MSIATNDVAGSTTAGTGQGLLLVLLSLVSVAATTLLAPIIPMMVAEFAAADPAAEQKAVLALAIPALVVAVTAPFMGKVIDSFGRRNLLVASLIAYALIGVLPAFLGSLEQIIVSRVALGFAEAAIMTASTTLIGDYFRGADREKWFVAQASAASISAIVFFGIGGALGEVNWRYTYYVYGVALLAVPLALAILREPAKTEAERTATNLRFPWNSVIWLYVIAFVGAIIFFIPQIQVAFLLNERGITSPQTIGLTTAIGAVAVPLGSIIFKLRAQRIFWHNLLIAFALMAAGLALMAWGPEYYSFVAGIVVANLGCGIFLPLMVTAIMAHLHFDLRGRGTGGWQTAFFIGNFVSPLFILGLAGAAGGTSAAVGVFAIAAAVAAVVTLAIRPRNDAVAV
ncbi:MAG: MFS transporter [Mesorhizobium sp.]|nr:MFS transporter [Mesorhizobium sp.]